MSETVGVLKKQYFHISRMRKQIFCLGSVGRIFCVVDFGFVWSKVLFKSDCYVNQRNTRKQNIRIFGNLSVIPNPMKKRLSIPNLLFLKEF